MTKDTALLCADTHPAACCRVIHSDMLGYWQIKQLYFIRENTQRKIVCYQVCRH